jgi:hypothetical protein
MECLLQGVLIVINESWESHLQIQHQNHFLKHEEIHKNRNIFCSKEIEWPKNLMIYI